MEELYEDCKICGCTWFKNELKFVLLVCWGDSVWICPDCLDCIEEAQREKIDEIQDAWSKRRRLGRNR